MESCLFSGCFWYMPILLSTIPKISSCNFCLKNLTIPILSLPTLLTSSNSNFSGPSSLLRLRYSFFACAFLSSSALSSSIVFISYGALSKQFVFSNLKICLPTSFEITFDSNPGSSIFFLMFSRVKFCSSILFLFRVGPSS